MENNKFEFKIEKHKELTIADIIELGWTFFENDNFELVKKSSINEYKKVSSFTKGNLLLYAYIYVQSDGTDVPIINIIFKDPASKDVPAWIKSPENFNLKLQCRTKKQLEIIESLI
jgi:hypothetical protein